MAPDTLPGLLQRAASDHARRGLTLYDRRGREAGRLSWAEVLDLARRGAGRWRAAGLGPGDVAVIALPTSWAWMEAWLGAVLAGALPVATAAGGALTSLSTHAQRIGEIARHLQAGAVLVTDALAGEPALRDLPATTPERFAALHPAPGDDVRAAPEDTAFLQLTSGSTGRPRAVQIPHAALVHNNRASDEAIGAPFDAPASSWCESVVSWLPLYHDMGLVGCLWLSVSCGFDLHLFEPRTFLARPRLWLEHLGRHGVSLAPAPNFAYQLCADRVSEDEAVALDLAPWRAAMTGAEMVRPETVEAFNRRFAPASFDPRRLRPCYGLAEGTLAVTFDLRGEGARTRPAPEEADRTAPREIVSVGSPVRDTQVRIVSPSGARLPEGAVGEVEIRGPGVFTGYANDPEATRETLRDGWFATGDLGFLHEGELYITGRLKEILIIRGQNLMPHEIEWVAESVTGGGGAERSGAFSVARGAEGEAAVLVMEVDPRDHEDLDALRERVRKRVGRELGLTLADVAFVRRGKIPKTTSGKVRRRALREMYLEDRLERLA